jgi:type I restriction enzyme M protein
MALKKSELYSSLWESCDQLRGGMDASQYKDYVLVLLFAKYVSDKYAGVQYAPITIPEGASFADMVALKGKSDIGDQINKRIIAPLASANKVSDMPDFILIPSPTDIPLLPGSMPPVNLGFGRGMDYGLENG